MLSFSFIPIEILAAEVPYCPYIWVYGVWSAVTILSLGLVNKSLINMASEKQVLNLWVCSTFFNQGHCFSLGPWSEELRFVLRRPVSWKNFYFCCGICYFCRVAMLRSPSGPVISQGLGLRLWTHAWFHLILRVGQLGWLILQMQFQTCWCIAKPQLLSLFNKFPVRY